MMKQSVLITVIALAAAVQFPAFADIVSEGTVVVGGSGFGNLPRALTIQSNGPSDLSESGCIAPDGSGGLIAGGSACSLASGAVGGDEQNPLGFPKQSAPTLSSLGITSGTQLGILFDAIQPQNSNNNVVTINDLTLKLYSGTTLVFTASGTFADLATNPGNGNTDYLFMLNAAQAAAFNSAVAGNFGDRVALDSTISFPRQSAGPDSFALVNATGLVSLIQTVPEPGPFSVVGTGLIALALLKRKYRSPA